MKWSSKVFRNLVRGNVNVEMNNGLMELSGNNAVGAEFVAAKVVKIGRPRRNKALAAMKRANRKQNRK